MVRWAALSSLLLIAFIPAEMRIYALPPVIVLFGLLGGRKPITALAFIIFLVGFPIYIRFMGKDIGVLSTILIFTFYFLALIAGKIKPDKKLIIPSGIILFVYGFSIFELQSTDMLMRSMRLYSGLISGFMLLQLIISYVKLYRDVNFLLSIVVLMLILQAVIAIAQSIYPVLDKTVFVIFQSRVGILGQGYIEGVYRALGTVGDYELLAEWLACGIPLTLALRDDNYLIKKTFPLIIIILLGGILATSTRGGLVVAILGTLIFISWLFFHKSRKGLIYIVSISVISFLAYYLLEILFPSQSGNYISRFSVISFNSISEREKVDLLMTFSNLIGRQQLWFNQPAFVTTFHILGYGFMDLGFLGYQHVGSLHSLYFTIWFQGGVIGSAAWLWFLLASIMRKRITLASRNILLGGLNSFFVAMLIGEIKVEFLRYEHTIQFVFFIIGVMVALIELLNRGMVNTLKSIKTS